MRTWLIKIVEGRYRCWDDFLYYGMASAGHSDPPGAPMKLLSVGDEVYAFLNTRGYVGRGKVTKAASLADQFVVDGNFIAIDGSGSFNQMKLTDILLLRRSDMRQDGDDPFVAAQREMEEELSLGRADIAELHCTGLVEDSALLQPELVFAARTTLSRDEIDRRVDRAEHHATWAVVASGLDVNSALKDPMFTPVALASLILWDRLRPASGAAQS